MHRLRIMQLFVLLAIPSVPTSMPLTEYPSTSEELQSQEGLMKEMNIQHVNTDESRRMCLKEFGNPHYCDCVLNQKIINLNFATFLQIVSHQTDAHGYSDLTYNKVLEVQEKCTTELRHY